MFILSYRSYTCNISDKICFKKSISLQVFYLHNIHMCYYCFMRGESMAHNKNNVDMINGPLWNKILKFSVLFMLTTLLQHLYSAADIVVVGRYAGKDALAGVGTCSHIVNLFVNFIVGLSAGVSILLGQALGSGRKDEISKASHTAIAL